MTSWLRAAPRVLDPLLALVEGIDRTVRRLRPIRPGGILHLERSRHRGDALVLADGTRIRAGDPVGVLHFDNRRVRELAAGSGWQTAGYLVARDDLRALAAQHAALPADDRPVAYTGVTILAPLARRMGFEVRPRGRSAFERLEDWYLRTILARWARDGRDRLQQGHGALRAERTWLSADALLRRFAAGA